MGHPVIWQAVHSFTIKHEVDICYSYLHSGSKCLAQVACLWSEMHMFQRVELREEGLPLPSAFQNWFLWYNNIYNSVQFVPYDHFKKKSAHFFLQTLNYMFRNGDKSFYVVNK